MADRPGELSELAEALALTHADLVAYYGAERLLQIMADKFQEANCLVRADALAYQMVRKDRDFWHVRSLLARWPDTRADDLLISFICSPDLDPSLRADLNLELFWRNRDLASEAARVAARRFGDRSCARFMLGEVAETPHGTDLDLLLWGAQQDTDPECLYCAIVGLERLGYEAPEWDQRLGELSGSTDPFVRLQTLTALARRGNEALLTEIHIAAVGEQDVMVRGEAVRCLGELDAQRYFAIMQRALLADHESWADFAPAAEEAALALARLGTPEAMTALIQGYLVISGWPPLQAIHCYLSDVVAQSERSDEPLQMHTWNWRQERIWRWRFA